MGNGKGGSGLSAYLRALDRKYCTPDKQIGSLLELEASELQKRGITCLLFDADNTLFSHHATSADAKTIAKLRSLSKIFRLAIVSNAPGEERVASLDAYFNKKLKLGIYISKSKERKPCAGPFLEALSHCGAKPKQTAMVGDKLFTDIAGAKMLGIYTIKVQPVDAASEPAYFLPIRLFEKLLAPE